jgi:hypothetical protein
MTMQPPPPPVPPSPEVAAEVARAIQEAGTDIANAAREMSGSGSSVSSVGNMIVIKRNDGTEIMLQNVDMTALSTLAASAPPAEVYERGPGMGELAAMFGAMGLAFALLFPLIRALASRLQRPAPAAKAAAPEQDVRLSRIESAVESVALEVERISEGQRFTTKLLSERSSLSPAPQFVAAPGEAVPISRPR